MSTPVISPVREEIVKEARRIEESGEWTSKGHFAAAQVWQGVHILLGGGVAVIAAIAAAKALKEIPNTEGFVAWLSIVVAAGSALLAFLNPGNRQAAHTNAGNNFDSLRSQARVFANIECGKPCADEELVAALKALSDHRDKLKSAGIHLPQWAYWLAKRRIKKGQTTYAVDAAK